RLQYALGVRNGSDTPSALGFSSFTENMGVSSFELTSADVTLAQGHSGHFLAEVANSAGVAPDGTPSNGKAFHVDEQVSAGSTKVDAYVRHADQGFSNDAAATSFVSGQTQYGAALDSKVGKRTTVSVKVDQERDDGISPLVLSDPTQYLNPGSAAQSGTAVDSHLSTVSATVAQKVGKATATVGVNAQSFTDNLDHTQDTSNTQSVTRLQMPFGKRWSALAEADETLSGANTALYPAREALGVDYQVADGVQIGATTQALHGGVFGDRHFTSLDTSVDRALSDNTQLTAKYSLYDGLGGFGAQQELGLNEHVMLVKHLRGEVGVEDSSGSLFNLTPAGQQFAQPYAVGSNSAAVGLTGGSDYHAGVELVGDQDFKASARFEHSSSSFGTNNVIRLGAAGTFNVADKLLFSFDRNAAANQLLGAMPSSADVSLGLAVRDPRADNHNWLVEYEYRQNPGLLPTQLLTPGQNQQQSTLMTSGSVLSQDGTLSLEGIESVSPRLELYGKLASRHSASEVAPGVFTTDTIEFVQARARYDIGRRYDVTAEAREILQNVGAYHEAGYIGEFGYLLSSELRAAFGYEGGWVDQTLFDPGTTHKGAYLDLTMRVQNLWKH
ncbi:MAG TPA: hypothetical protein VGD50_06395, partial [Candidatus Baltobacteraceae bacterium]